MAHRVPPARVAWGRVASWGLAGCAERWSAARSGGGGGSGSGCADGCVVCISARRPPPSLPSALDSLGRRPTHDCKVGSPRTPPHPHPTPTPHPPPTHTPTHPPTHPHHPTACPPPPHTHTPTHHHRPPHPTPHTHHTHTHFASVLGRGSRQRTGRFCNCTQPTSSLLQRGSTLERGNRCRRLLPARQGSSRRKGATRREGEKA